MIEPIRLALAVACPPDHAFEVCRDRAHATEVEIRFVERGTSTLVEIEHRGWEALGAEGGTWRDRYRGRWATLLPSYVAAATMAA